MSQPNTTTTEKLTQELLALKKRMEKITLILTKKIANII